MERDAKKTIRDLWTPTIEFYAHYSLEAIKEDVESLASLVFSTSKSNESAKLMAVRKKYANKKFAKISQLPGKSAQPKAEMLQWYPNVFL